MEKELFNTQGDKIQPEDMEIKKLDNDKTASGILGMARAADKASAPPMIFKKILDIQEELPAILKGKEFKQGGKTIYKFRGIDDLYNAVNPVFKKHRVFMTPEVLDSESSERPTASGGVLFYEKMDVKYKLYAEDGSFVEATTRGIGMDSGDKAANKAMSVAQKYALIQIFSIPTDDKKDPENDGHEVANQDFLEIMTLLEKCKTREDMALLWDTYPHLHDNKMVLSVFAKHGTKLKGGKS